MNEKILKLPFLQNLLNLLVLALLAVLCLFPILHILALSLSSATAAASGRVTIWPVDFTVQSYQFVLANPAFGKSFLISLLRVLVGTPVNMLLTILFRILLPLSLPVLATVTLFVAVAHWNSWFDGLILMNSPAKYPLQSYLQTVVINPDPRMLTERDLALLKIISNHTTRAAEIFIAMIPILVIYPFLQRYFTTGIKLGSIKG